MRTCIICGAGVRNLNPKTVTCSPMCTRARDAGRTRERQQEYEIAIADAKEEWKEKGKHDSGPVTKINYGLR